MPCFRARSLAAISTLLLSAAPALAAPPVDPDLDAARALFRDAEADEQAARWGDALVKLRRASTVKMTPGIRFHIALCEERTGHLVAALEDYTAAQTAARAENNLEVLGLVSDPLLAIKVRVPTLTVDLPPRSANGGPNPHAEVRLDGTVIAAAALGTPIPVDVGSHTVQALASGQGPYAVTVTLVERQAQAVHIEWSPLGGSSGAAHSPPDRSQASRRAPPTLAIVATAAAVVLVAGGVGAYAAAGSDQSYWQGVCRGQGPSCGNATPVRAWDATALGAWIAGAGAGALAVVLWTKTGVGTDAPRAELHGGPGAVSLTVTF